MSVQKVSVLVPPLRPVPPGAAWAANAVAWLFVNDPRQSGGLAGLVRRGPRAPPRRPRRPARCPRAAGADRRWPGATSDSQPEFAKDLIAAAWPTARR